MNLDFLDNIWLLFRKEKEPYLRLKRILGFYPHNIKLYQLALKHKSVAYFEREERKARGEKLKRDFKSALNNERLEFLGDAILGAIVADILYRHYGTKQEGFLTSLRSKIVCRRSLGELAVKIGLDKLILHADNMSNAHNSYMNGNAFEAFFGAIYLDRGYSYCYRFMENVIFRKYINIERVSREDENHKSALIEWCQKYQYKFNFQNREVREGGSPKFFSSLTVENILVGEGEGYSKKESDQNAAQNALRRIRRDAAFRAEIQDASVRIRQQSREQSMRDRSRSLLDGRTTAVFDLDGTLLDTLQDLYLSTNYALEQCGYPQRTLDEVRQFVGNGVGMLIHRAITVPHGKSDEARSVSPDELEHCLSIFKQHYVEHCQDNTKLYDGIRELLTALREKGYKLAIVSNKLQSGVTELCDLWFKDIVEVAIGESEGIERKPAPDMVNEALRQLSSTPEEAFYVGDSEVDIQTAKAAGIPCISVLWGFRSREYLTSNGARILADKPETILTFLA